MATKKKVRTTPQGPAIMRKIRTPTPLGRGGDPPALLKHQPKTYAFRLVPKNGTHGAISVWGYRTANGWTGWIEELRTHILQTTSWSNEMWEERPAVDPKPAAEALKAIGKK